MRAKRIQTDGLEAVSSTQTIPLLPGVSTVHVVAGHHQRRVRSRLGSGALNGEVADGILVVGVDPKAEGVNHGNGRSRELEGKRTRNGTRSGSTIATPVVSVRRGRKARGSHCSRRGDDVTVVRGRLSGEEGQEGVELDRGRGGVTEVELHSQHAVGGLRDRCRTDDSVVGVASVASRGRSRGRDVSGRHVVSVDFDSIDVGDHSELVLELQIDGGHTRHTREGLAEVLGSRGGLRGGSESNNGPGTVGEANILPVSRGRSSVLPVSVVTDGGIEGEGLVLLLLLGHHFLEHHVAVDTVEFDVGLVGPSVTQRILHSKRVDGVGVGSKAGFDGSRLRVDQGGGGVEDGGAVENLEGLFTGPGTRLLNNLQVVLVGTAIERECKRNYG